MIYKDRLLQPSDILVDNGTIIAVGYNLDYDSDDTELIDCTGKYILPGYLVFLMFMCILENLALNTKKLLKQVQCLL